jgi:hemolysin-activating ACP:hemolysin acyltransferase
VTKTAAQKAKRAARKLTLAPPTLAERLAAESRAYCYQWCDPVGYRAALQRALVKNITEMRAQRLARIKRRDDLISWLIQFETWREENGRPIAYCRRAPAPAAAEAAKKAA